MELLENGCTDTDQIKSCMLTVVEHLFDVTSYEGLSQLLLSVHSDRGGDAEVARDFVAPIKKVRECIRNPSLDSGYKLYQIVRSIKPLTLPGTSRHTLRLAAEAPEPEPEPAPEPAQPSAEEEDDVPIPKPSGKSLSTAKRKATSLALNEEPRPKKAHGPELDVTCDYETSPQAKSFMDKFRKAARKTKMKSWTKRSESAKQKNIDALSDALGLKTNPACITLEDIKFNSDDVKARIAEPGFKLLMFRKVTLQSALNAAAVIMGPFYRTGAHNAQEFMDTKRLF